MGNATYKASLRQRRAYAAGQAMLVIADGAFEILGNDWGERIHPGCALTRPGLPVLWLRIVCQCCFRASGLSTSIGL